MNTDTEKQELTPAQRYDALLRRVTEEALAALPIRIPREDVDRAWDRLRVALKDAGMRDARIYLCHPPTIARAAILSALTGLFPGGPMPPVYVFVRRMSRKIQGNWIKRPELQWEISARGMAALAERSGYSLDAIPVYEGEPFKVSGGMRPNIEHERPPGIERNFDNLIAVYVTARRLTDPYPTAFRVLYRDGIEKRRAMSMSFRDGSGPWIDWPDEMALKTGIRYAVARNLCTLDEVAAIALKIEGSVDRIDEELEVPVPLLEQEGAPAGTPLLEDRDALNELDGLLADAERELEPVGPEIDPDTGEEIPPHVGRTEGGEE